MKCKLITLFLSSFLLVSCGGNVEQSDSEPVKQVYTVDFYDGEKLLDSQEVEEGDVVTKPTDPVKEDYAFVGWYIDTDFTQEYDFSTIVNANLSLFAYFRLDNYFADYDSRFIPTYSPLTMQNKIFEGEQNVDLNLLADGISLNSNIAPKEIVLEGALKNLEITGVSQSGNKLSIHTKGTLIAGEGQVVLAKECSLLGCYLTTTILVERKYLGVESTGYTIDFENKTINFTVTMEGMELANPDNLTPEEYLALVQGGTYSYFSLDQAEGYTFSFESVSSDFKAFGAKLTCEQEINKDRIEEIADLVFRVKEEGLSIHEERAYKLDLSTVATSTDVLLSYSGIDTYSGRFDMNLFGCVVNESLKEHKDELLKEPFNKNSIVTIAGTDVTITSIDIINDIYIQGHFDVTIIDNESDVATISINPIKISDELTIEFTKDLWSEETVTPPNEVSQYQIGYDKSEIGTITQSVSSSYRGALSIIENIAFEDEGPSGMDELINGATNIGFIAYGLYSGDTPMARFGAAGLLGIEPLRNPTDRILDTLATIIDELKNIEARIDELHDELKTIEEELADLGQEALLSNFLDAYSTWSAFVTDYYTPMGNIISDYTNNYFRYFYDLALSSYNQASTAQPVVDLYYDYEGDLAYIDDHDAFSIDGRTVDRSASRTITLPELPHAIAGIRANKGHVYPDIENDIAVDLMSYGDMEEELLADVLRTIRFNAMKSYFSSVTNITNFTNIFANFCSALTASEFEITLQSAFTPLDCFSMMLECIFNFGFEIEPDLNLVISKIGSLYYCAKSIVSFSNVFNHGEIQTFRFESFEATVKKELTDKRFHRPNDEEGNIYCFAASGYVKYNLETYSLIGRYGDVCTPSGVICQKYGEDINYDAEELKEFSSIEESAIKLMSLKVKVYNKVKKTAYTFKEYLARINMIPIEAMEHTYGIVYKINKVVKGNDDTFELTYPVSSENGFRNRYYPGSKFAGETECGPDMAEHIDNCALKGKAYSLVDDSIFDGLLFMGVDISHSATSVAHYVTSLVYFGKYICHHHEAEFESAPCAVYSYYCHFEPVAIN